LLTQHLGKGARSTGHCVPDSSVEFGLGDHIKDLLNHSPQPIVVNQLYEWLFTTCIIVEIALGKLAIIAFILQIEGHPPSLVENDFIYLCHVKHCGQRHYYPSCLMQCTPTAKLWAIRCIATALDVREIKRTDTSKAVSS